MPNGQIEQKSPTSIFLHITLSENLSNKQAKGTLLSALSPCPRHGNSEFTRAEFLHSVTPTGPPTHGLQLYGCVPFLLYTRSLVSNLPVWGASLGHLRRNRTQLHSKWIDPKHVKR